MNSKLSLIAVIGKNRELGKDNKLLWHIPGDLPRFKKLTTGHPVIMGRKTFQSLPKPFSERTNIVISANPSFHPEGAVVAQSLEEALEMAKKSPGNEEIFVVGGGSVYAQAIPFADRLYLTIVDTTAEADTYFPDYFRFSKVVSSEVQEGGGYHYTYFVLEPTG